MYISGLSIQNYKSFFTRVNIELSPKFNVVVGQNNVGKTALVEAISLTFGSIFHKSERTIQHKGNDADGPSEVILTWTISREELIKWIKENRSNIILIRNTDLDVKQEIDKVKVAFAQQTHRLICHYHNGTLVYAIFKEMDSVGDATSGFTFDLLENNNLKERDANVTLNGKNNLGFLLASELENTIYHFRAERFNQGQDNPKSTLVLKPDASNLAQVLHTLLTTRRYLWSEYVKLVRSVFPDITDITVPLSVASPTTTATVVKILLSHIDPSKDRDDLAIPLQNSGTGIGQVLAILFAVMITDSPITIIIDEPQSFLHPSAIRKLFSILHLKFSQHQYIVTTHSPLVVSAAKPESIILLKKEDGMTHAQMIDATEKNKMRTLLEEVGASFSDVFGAESILWVEGPTEEESFPLIVMDILNQPLLGTAILSCLSVGELQSKHKEKVYQIYKRLTEGPALIPPALGFIFDREVRSDEEIKDMERASEGKIHFLPRRMYENYLIDPDAILAVIAELENFSDIPIGLDVVLKWIKKNKWEKKYFKDLDSLRERSDDTWTLHVHGGNFLNDMFKELSENRYEYESYKQDYGSRLTKWIVDNRPEQLQEVADLIDKLLSPI